MSQKSINPLGAFEKFLGRRNFGLIIVGLALLQLAVLFYHPTLRQAPSHMQADTQTDHLSITYGFLDNNFDFFRPQTYRLNPVYPPDQPLPSNEGVTRVDFPIHEFAVALAMKMLGTRHPMVFRVYCFLFGFIGLLYLFKLGQLFKLQNVKSAFVVGFIFFLPVFAYHLNGFIPSIPALGTAVIGYYHFFKYKFEGKYTRFWAFLFFLSLSALVRMPFTIFVFATFLHDLRDYWKSKKFPLVVMVGYLFAFGLVFAHSFYNDYMESMYGSIFMNEYPSTQGFDHFLEIVSETFSRWALHYFTVAHYLLLFIALVLLVMAIVKKYPWTTGTRALGTQLIIVFVGSLGYGALLLTQFHDYDFYFLDLFIIPVALFVMLFLCVATGRQFMITGLLLMLIPMGYSSFIRVHECADFDPNDPFQQEMEAYQGNESFLNSLKLDHAEPIGVLMASSSNIPLLHLNRPGFIHQDSSTYSFEQVLSWPVTLFAVARNRYPLIKTELVDTEKLEVLGHSEGLVFLNRKGRFNGLLVQPSAQSTSDLLFSSSQSFEGEVSPPWYVEPQIIQKNITFQGECAAYIPKERPFGVSFKRLLGEGNLSTPRSLNYDGFLRLREMESPVLLCVNIEREGRSVLYMEHTLHDTPKSLTSTWYHFEGSVELEGQFRPSDLLSIYLWNPGENEIHLDELKFEFFQ